MSTLIDILQKVTPGRFVAVRYTDSRGAEGIYTFILADYGRAVRAALAAVEGMTPPKLAERCPPGITLDTMRDARAALIASYQKSISSDYDGSPRPGQYTETVKVDGETVKGLRRHVDDPSRVYVAGIKVGFSLISEGEPRKSVNSRPLTIAKNAITRGLSVARWRHLKGGEIVRFAAEGETFEAFESASAAR